MWERLYIWIDMYCPSASIASEIIGDQKNKLWCGVLCCVILSRFKIVKIYEKLQDYIWFDMS